MWLGALVKVTAVGVATLATSSGINMWQTINTIRTTSTSPEMDGRLLTITGKSSHQIVEELQKMNRQEILNLFLACPSVQLDDLDGEWDGLLLDNNTWIMTRVAEFLTHGLFGRGRRWNGKGFFGKGSRTGVNRFQPAVGKVETQHGFTYHLGKSRLDSKPAILLEYTGSESKVSPWYGMKDELRQINEQALVGLGSMSWSGGIWNASPFCLYQNDHAEGKMRQMSPVTTDAGNNNEL